MTPCVRHQALVLACLFATASATLLAQAKIETEQITFDSADGVELQGIFYKSNKGSSGSSVILLHSLDVDPNSGDWNGLAETLAGKGFNVLRFDFRGHGTSFKVDTRTFWDSYYGNDKVLSDLIKKRVLPDKIDKKDLLRAKGYTPWFANDIMAARVALDKMNDAGKTNTGSTYIIGATDAAALGMLYLTAEWTRPQVLPQALNLPTLPPDPRLVPGGSDMAGKDIAGCVWLSPYFTKDIRSSDIETWVKAYTELREKNPMFCLYGAEDVRGKAAAHEYVNKILVADPKDKRLTKLTYTTMEGIEKTKNRGVDLLGKNLGTEQRIIDYLETLEKDRKNVIATPSRNYTKPPFIVPTLFVR
jgi:hypothetical protein